MSSSEDLPEPQLPQGGELRYDTIQYIYVRSKADKMASVI